MDDKLWPDSPPTQFRNFSGNIQINVPLAILEASPNGTWRKIKSICISTLAGGSNYPSYAVLRSGAYYTIANALYGAAGGYMPIANDLDVMLAPGDSLVMMATQAGAVAVTGTVGYVDYISDAPTFKKGRRG